MRILYFDLWSPRGHKVFNTIHLKALSQIGDVCTVFREGYYKSTLPRVTSYLEIPESYYVKNHGYYYTRIQLARMIRWVWRQVASENWDYIIIASYDPLALFLSQCFKKSIVIDHNTLGLLDSKLYGFPLRHLGKDIKHVVFNAAMKAKLNEHGIYNVAVVPHGFLPMQAGEWSKEEENEILRRYALTSTDRIVFLPSLSKSTNDLLGHYLYSDDFNDFLKSYGLKLITKSKRKRASKSNISIIDGYLPEKDYHYLFLHSSCNVLLYSADFKYRTSGVLNECFANKIPCIISDSPALKEYLPYINNDKCVFRNTKEVKESILSVLERDSGDYYRNLNELQSPLNAWAVILK